MSADDKKSAKKEPAAEKQDRRAKTEAVKPETVKAEGGKTAAAPSNKGMGEGQKPVSQATRTIGTRSSPKRKAMMGCGLKRCKPRMTVVNSRMIRAIGKIAPTTRTAGAPIGAGVFQRGHKIFLALACEFFLRGFEAGDACGDSSRS